MNIATTRVKRLVPMAVFFTALLVMMAPAARAQTADEGIQLYTDKCARCHQDDGLGLPDKYPPIAGNPGATDLAYVIDIVTNGLSGKEILGVAYDLEMPGFGKRLTAAEIQSVSEYAVELAISGPSTTPPPTKPIGEGTAEIGNNIFRGTTLLAGGGVACIACHSAGEYDRIGGPGLARDLNGIVDEFGRSGFIDSITDPVVDQMIAVFAEHPITDQEAADLAAFLETTSTDTTQGSSFDLLIVLGSLGFLVLILVTAQIIRGPQETYVTKLRSTR